MNGMTNPLWLLVAAGLVAVVPIVIGLITSYLKVNIVLSMIRNALGAQQVPGGMVIFAVSFALTAFIMGPVVDKTQEIASKIDLSAFTKDSPTMQHFSKLTPLLEPWREFMRAQASEREIAVFQVLAQPKVSIQTEDLPAPADETSLRVLIPAFVLTELKEAFAMGFVVLLPFLVIDLIVANILAGLGMTMMSPTMISLPVKLLLFVISDAWLLIVKGLIYSYQ